MGCLCVDHSTRCGQHKEGELGLDPNEHSFAVIHHLADPCHQACAEV